MTNKFSFLDHFFIFKKILIRVIILFFIFLIISFSLNEKLYNFFSNPLLVSLNLSGGEIIATQLISTFIVPLKLALLTSFYLVYPYFIIELWFFVKPGLYQKERLFFKTLLFMSSLLIFLAFIFCFYLVFPEIINFFIKFSPKGLNLKIDINYYLMLMINLIFAFTIAFQIPIIVLALIKFNLINIKKIKKSRPYVYVSAFVLSALLTPPDVLSQVFLAVPMIFLFELGLFLSTCLKK